VRWLTKVATSLRDRDLVVSSAHVIEAVRLAETLATLRDRPLAGLTEVTDATRAVLCEGDELAVRFVIERLVVGQALGAVNDGVPTVPLDADLQARCRSLRVRREAQPRVHDLDLRRPHDQEKSKLFHRLRLLELDWVHPADSAVQGRGTFRETWQSQWRPELAVALVVASVWGTTVEAAATTKVQRVSATGTLAELTATVERCLLADLPVALRELLDALAERAAEDVDVVHLMEALPALARAHRYGDVRGTDTTALDQVAYAMVLRICAGLPQAVSSLDDEAARRAASRGGRRARSHRVAVERKCSRPSPPLAHHAGWTAGPPRRQRSARGPLRPDAVRRRAAGRRRGPGAPGAVPRCARGSQSRLGSTGSSPTAPCC
jgi:hypothetical protein